MKAKNAFKKMMRTAVHAYQESEQDYDALKKDLDKSLDTHLKEEGVPEELSDRMHHIAATHPERDKKEIEAAMKEAIEHKQKGSITEEGLTKVVEEAVMEGEKGVSKEEIRDIIKEVLQSELQKGFLFAQHTARAENKVLDKPLEPSKFAMPMKSDKIEDGGMIKLKPETKAEQTEDLSKINITYPLTYKGGKIKAYSNIRYDPKEQGLNYRVIEPQLHPGDLKAFQKIEHALVEELEVDFATLKSQSAEKYLGTKVNQVVKYYNMSINPRVRDIMDYYIHRDFVGLGKIEPLMEDPNIEDVSCDGVNIPIYVYHRDPRFGSVRTNIMFKTHGELDSFVMKLAQRTGRSISVADPLLDGALPSGDRVQATFGSGISMKGSNFTIRKFTADPLTAIDLLNYGTVSAEMLAYLWIAIEHGKSILVAGPTASGKTTMLNALSLFVRPELKVVSIEDTPELRIPHENWVPQVARTGFGPEQVSGKKMGEVSLFDLLKASLRQRPDFIIVGEVRGKEAYVLFQQIATGHSGMSTIHADSLDSVISRLRTPPIELPPSLVQHLEILVVLARQRIHGKYKRRTKEIVEITGYDLTNDRPKVNDAYTWNAPKDVYAYTGNSHVLKEIMNTTGSTPQAIAKEIKRRAHVLEWMQHSEIRDYKNVGRVIHEYYQNPDRLMERIK